MNDLNQTSRRKEVGEDVLPMRCDRRNQANTTGHRMPPFAQLIRVRLNHVCILPKGHPRQGCEGIQADFRQQAGSYGGRQPVRLGIS